MIKNHGSAMKLGILGVAGRMGQLLAREILSKRYPATLASAAEHEKSWALKRDVGDILGLPNTGVIVTSDKDAAFKAADVLIDFSTPEALNDHAALAHQHKKPIVVGTTGLGDVEKAALIAAAKNAPVFYAANMSLGVNVLLALVEQAAAKLGPEFDIEIFEAHHKNKVDAPSGTALALGEAAAKGRNVKLHDVMIPARHGHTGARAEGAIGMSVFRGGDIVGDHTVTFAGPGERLELTHKASDRAIFAKGAVKAALWLKGKKPKLYGMHDMLDF